MVPFRRGIPITDPTASLGRGLGQGTRRTEAGGFTEYLRLGEPSAAYIPAALSRTGIELLPISLAHATAVESLPPHHRDPFGRLLVAQSTIEAIPVISVDLSLDPYGVSRLW